MSPKGTTIDWPFESSHRQSTLLPPNHEEILIKDFMMRDVAMPTHRSSDLLFSVCDLFNYLINSRHSMYSRRMYHLLLFLI